MAYGPVPWQMITRTLAVWYRLADPEEVRQHSHPSLQVEPDPVVRARFWDIRHDAGRAWPAQDIELREAAIGFPVRFDGEHGQPELLTLNTPPGVRIIR